MRKQLLAISLVFAMVLTISCSSDNGGESSSSGGDDTPSSGSAGGGLAGTSGTFEDSRDNKSYKWVKIGEQFWMAENLNFEVNGSKCYGGNTSNCATYGRLYNWSTALGVCPSDWHLPTSAEWDALTLYIESDKNCTTCAAKHLKTENLWSSNGGGFDTYGFSALPGGYGSSDDGSFNRIRYYGLWWTASEKDNLNGFYRRMDENFNEVRRYGGDKNYWLSVRCVR